MTDRSDELGALLGPGRVSIRPDDLEAHAADWSARALLDRRRNLSVASPALVVRPRAVEEVGVLLEWAQRTRTSVVPFGGGSNVVEGIRAPDEVVVDLRDLNALSEIDEVSHLVGAQAGVTGPQLRTGLGERGFILGHEPQSHDISTVGGWVATRACGQLSARYGGIEDLVAGIEAVLPGGSIVRSKAVPRRSTGPDVASLLIGSEGTLGIITEATLRVSPIPRERADACVRFDHMSEGVAACRALAQSELRPTVLRLYDREDAFLFTMGFDDPPVGPLLLLSFDGPDASRRARTAVELTKGEPLPDHFVAHWWSNRNNAVEEYAKNMSGAGVLGAHPMIDTMEVAATWSLLRALYHSMKERLTDRADVVACHLSHVYTDGACLYFTLIKMCGDDAEAASVHDAWWGAGMSACLEAGGSISHHHGIGRLKKRWLRAELDGFYQVLRAVKFALDPHGIMNPGVLEP